MAPNPKPPKTKQSKRTAPPASVVNDDDGVAVGETGDASRADTDEEGGGDDGDTADDVRLTRSCVHDEFVQTSETVEVTSKTGKKRKVITWSSACKHCPKVYQHKKQYALKKHLQSKHLDRAKIAEDKDDANRESQRANKNKPMMDKKMVVLDLYADWIIDSGVPLNTSDNEKFKKL